MARPYSAESEPAPFRENEGDGPRIRIVVGEDSLLVREGILRVLEQMTDVDVVGVSSDLDSLRSLIDDTAPDVVLSDIRMPPTDTDEGIRLAAELRSTHPEMGVLVLSQHSQPEYAMALFATGSHRRGFLLKERVRDPAELRRALLAVADGGSTVDGKIIDDLLRSRAQDDDFAFERLTPRERELLGLMAEGMSNLAMSTRLQISKRAIERHINSIFSKLDLGDAEDVSRRVKATLLYLSRAENG